MMNLKTIQNELNDCLAQNNIKKELTMNDIQIICNIFDQVHIALNRQEKDVKNYGVFKTFINKRLDRIEELEKEL